MKKLLGLLTMFAMGCGSTGSSNAPNVSGIYKITEGTREESAMGEEQIVSLSGKYLLVGQSGKVATIFECGAIVKDNEDSSYTAPVGNCVSYALDPGAGPGFFFMSGRTVFFEKTKLGMKAQITGRYPWIGFEFTINYEFQAVLSEEFMSETCPNCNLGLLSVPNNFPKRIEFLNPKQLVKDFIQ